MNFKFSQINLDKFFTTTIGLLALLGAFSIAPLSFSTLTGGPSCPSIYFVPACYIVLAGFIALLVFSFVKHQAIFFLGWLPVASIALLASVGEYSRGGICPLSSSGVPLCYYSLGVSVFLLAIFLLWKFSHKPTKKAKKAKESL